MAVLAGFVALRGKLAPIGFQADTEVGWLERTGRTGREIGAGSKAGAGSMDGGRDRTFASGSTYRLTNACMADDNQRSYLTYYRVPAPTLNKDCAGQSRF
jgi:hypothetical protein